MSIADCLGVSLLTLASTYQTFICFTDKPVAPGALLLFKRCNALIIFFSVGISSTTLYLTYVGIASGDMVGIASGDTVSFEYNLVYSS